MRALATTVRYEPSSALLIEGYASCFNQPDSLGDIVRAGAFARALGDADHIQMLLEHNPEQPAGRWLRLVEDGCGLWVRGWVESDRAKVALAAGIDGLSIGFRPRVWRPLRQGGRQLADIELIEISLVRSPMLRSARLRVV